MARYALIEAGVIKREVESDKEFRSGTPPSLPDKAIDWVPVILVNNDVDYDSATQIQEGPVEVITDTEVTRTWTAREKTQTELDERLAVPSDFAVLVNALVNKAVLNSADLPQELIDRINSRNRLDSDPEIR